MTDSHSASSEIFPRRSVKNAGSSRRSTDGSQTSALESRHWRDVFWLGIFITHLVGVGLSLGFLGLNRFKKSDRFKIDQYTNKDGHTGKINVGLTEDYWPLYAVAAGVGTFLGWSWLLFLGSRASQVMKVSVHILTAYLAVISVLCFWKEQFFWGVAFVIGSALQFLYVVSVIDRLPFTMLVLQKAVKMVWSLPDVMRVGYAFILGMLSWMVIWSFGVAGVVASSMSDTKCWWLLVIRDFGERSEIMSVCFAVLTSCFILWRLLYVSSTSMPMSSSANGRSLGGPIIGTCSGIWAWLRNSDRMVMVASTAMLMGMVLVGLAMVVVVESAVTSMYICYAEDPLLIHGLDAEFFNQMSETLHQRLQHRSAQIRLLFDIGQQWDSWFLNLVLVLRFRLICIIDTLPSLKVMR